MELDKHPDRLVITLEVPYSPEVVWATLTEPRHVVRWWGGYVALEAVPCSFTPSMAHIGRPISRV
jgi:uncharacterized protein YndB with AHSA1/START domain